MIMMQYKVKLPNDFDMNNIRKECKKMDLKQMDLKIYFLKPI